MSDNQITSVALLIILIGSISVAWWDLHKRLDANKIAKEDCLYECRIDDEGRLIRVPCYDACMDRHYRIMDGELELPK
jgi:hypothetical protein